MKSLGEAAARAVRQRQWFWCRHWNGFCDKPTWRLVAERLGLPLYQVVAFACRLEELANGADTRGNVAQFSAADFATALGMPEDAAARIYAALEDPAVGWISYEHVASFYERNRDSDDARDASNARKRRSRAKQDAIALLAQLASIGRVSPEQRRALEARLMLPPRALPDDAFYDLVTQVRRAELSTGRVGHIVTETGLSTGVTSHSVTESRHSVTEAAFKGRIASAVGHNVTPCDIVTVPEEESRRSQSRSVDNFGDGARGASQGSSEQEDARAESAAMGAAERWLSIDGMRILKERMEFDHARAETVLTRWLDQQLEGDAIALAEVIRAADGADYVGPRFHNLVVDGIARAKRHAQPQLALGPVGLKAAGGGS